MLYTLFHLPRGRTARASGPDQTLAEADGFLLPPSRGRPIMAYVEDDFSHQHVLAAISRGGLLPI